MSVELKKTKGKKENDSEQLKIARRVYGDKELKKCMESVIVQIFGGRA